jgi:hypothetical protein
VRLEGLGKLKKIIDDIIENRIRQLPACRIALPLATKFNETEQFTSVRSV